MNQHGSNAYDVRSLFDSLESVEEESPPASSSNVNGKAGQKHDADRMVCQALGYFSPGCHACGPIQR